MRVGKWPRMGLAYPRSYCTYRLGPGGEAVPQGAGCASCVPVLRGYDGQRISVTYLRCGRPHEQIV